MVILHDFITHNNVQSQNSCSIINFGFSDSEPVVFQRNMKGF